MRELKVREFNFRKFRTNFDSLITSKRKLRLLKNLRNSNEQCKEIRDEFDHFTVICKELHSNITKRRAIIILFFANLTVFLMKI